MRRQTIPPPASCRYNNQQIIVIIKYKVVNEDDVAAFERVKRLRNELAHALTGMLLQELPAELTERFDEMVSLLDKIERWWMVNVEIAVDPDLHDEEIDQTKVIPSQLLGLRLLLDIALGSEDGRRGNRKNTSTNSSGKQG